MLEFIVAWLFLSLLIAILLAGSLGVEYSGQGGIARLGAAGAELDVTEWEWAEEAVLVETTKAKSLGRRRRKSVLLDGRVRFNLIWDDAQIIPTTLAIGAGTEIVELRLYHGSSNRFAAFPFICERVTTINNASGDVVRIVVEGWVNGPVTYPTAS